MQTKQKGGVKKKVVVKKADFRRGAVLKQVRGGAKKQAAKLKKPQLLGATELGISPDHLIGGPVIHSVGASTCTDCCGEVDNVFTGTQKSFLSWDKLHYFKQPLISARASFWLGTAFGIAVMGALVILAWYLVQVDLAGALAMEAAK